MFAALRGEEQQIYHSRLHALLGVREDASWLRIHDLIVAGFPAQGLVDLCERGEITPIERDRIVPLRALRRRAVAGQRLTGEESERLFRVVHITLVAESLFGEGEAARRWLSRPDIFDGQTPFEMIMTTPGMYLVEERIIRAVEGIFA
ncbi:DUF2384 domain-containing protein [Paralcaligenes sp. KSB-10]|uniref:antitoxin Xre/MbcA/ParS toxin-binding domain-containing protein n=1 Tax=Paralcaligenes sp. KSB-10 TaxID=2901142 RepID=UPI001E45F109|nr:antitoxin Xre/MbcA/ParS toxin-binding domain-containing protein [Paralcaligenes sp. KSB-10]UHL63509.1 DUF2384 domain-containing protein [Paralcaligenes sp. KSB-10]